MWQRMICESGKLSRGWGCVLPEKKGEDRERGVRGGAMMGIFYHGLGMTV